MPGKASRKGISLIELARRFPDEESARRWFEQVFWKGDHPICPRCNGTNTYRTSGKKEKMAYRCRTCVQYFSIRTGTLLENSPVPLLKWVYAIYLEYTSPKGISSMQLHRDINVTQKTSWYMLQRIRKVGTEMEVDLFERFVEAEKGTSFVL